MRSLKQQTRTSLKSPVLSPLSVRVLGVEHKRNVGLDERLDKREREEEEEEEVEGGSINRS